MAIGGVLFDIDGVLVTSWRPIDGAAETLRALEERQIARSFLTNTTTRTRQQIAELLCAAGIEVAADEVVTALVAKLRGAPITAAKANAMTLAEV